MIIACVYRSGRDFRASHVRRLYDQVMKHAHEPAQFLCLTNEVEQVEALNVPCAALQHDWPRWWPKLELFKLKGPVLYLDLDTTVRGDLAPLLDAARKYRLIALARFHGPTTRMASGVMAWNDDLSEIYTSFAEDAENKIETERSDQLWIWKRYLELYGEEIPHWQKELPGLIAHHRADILKEKNSFGVDPHKARVIVFQGPHNRPWDLPASDPWR